MVKSAAAVIDARSFEMFSGDKLEMTGLIIAALLAERERCARIVERGLGRTNTAIARAIREGGDA
jgi:hypothetical protein